MADLLHYANQLIIDLKPSRIFIYEGDNDLSAGKTPDQILSSANNLLDQIRENLPKKVNVYFLSAKPSLARAHLRSEFEAFNMALREWTNSKKNVHYIDVWSPMMGVDGKVMNDIFIADGLHMNEKGYTIWKGIIGPYLK